MTEKDTPSTGQLLMLAGLSSAVTAGHMMVDTMTKLHRAGQPARVMMGMAPFAFAGWMMGQAGAKAVPGATPEPVAPSRTRSARVAERPTPIKEAEAEVAEIVAEAVPEPVVEEIIAAEQAVEESAPVEAVAEVEAATEGDIAFEPERDVAAESDVVAEPKVETASEGEAASEVEAELDAATEGDVEVEAAAESEGEAQSEAAPEVFVAERPTALAAPREGGADDLKLINGVGPKLAGQLNGLGYYHFDQIAAWTEAEMELVDLALDGVPGRPARNDWIGQAAELARTTKH